jgi:hypothetical protein
MRYLLLKVVNYNWSLKGPGSWDKTIWKINSDGSYIRTDKYRPEDNNRARYKRKKGQMRQSEIGELIKIINSPLPDTHADGCDGDAWEIIVYSRDGEIIQAVDCGYVFGVDILERLLELIPQGTQMPE